MENSVNVSLTVLTEKWNKELWREERYGKEERAHEKGLKGTSMTGLKVTRFCQGTTSLKYVEVILF